MSGPVRGEELEGLRERAREHGQADLWFQLGICQELAVNLDFGAFLRRLQRRVERINAGEEREEQGKR